MAKANKSKQRNAAPGQKSASIGAAWYGVLFDGTARSRRQLEEARAAVEAEIEKLESEIAKRRTALEFFSGLMGGTRRVGATPATVASPTPNQPQTAAAKGAKKRNAGPSSGMSPKQRHDRRARVMAVLKKLPKAQLRNLSVDDALAAVKKAKVDMGGVAPNGMRIAVANILLHAKDLFKEVKPGIFASTGK